MKLLNSGAARLLVLTTALAALTLMAAADVQAATAANQITVRDQNLDTGIVVVDSVTAAHSGWVVIYETPDFTVENLVGYAPVHAGENLGVKVVVSLPKINREPMLWAVLQADDGVPGVFEWGLKQRAYDDDPIAQNGQAVMAQFATIAPVPLPAFLQTASGGASLKTMPAARITVHNQDVQSGVILVEAITTTQPGWVVFYRNPNFTPREIVGYAPIYPGVNTNVKATLDTTKLGKSTEVWAQLHLDDGLRDVFEWGRETEEQPPRDWPLIDNQAYVRASFGTTAEPALTSVVDPAAAGITVHDQTLNTGIIVLDSVTTPHTGWIVVYKESNFTAGEIVGYAPVYKGTNLGVKVTIDTAKVGEQARLWPVLHVDGGLQHIFEWGYNSKQFSDPPAFARGQYVAASFSTARQHRDAVSDDERLLRER